jgi:hypothetical protein
MKFGRANRDHPNFILLLSYIMADAPSEMGATLAPLNFHCITLGSLNTGAGGWILAFEFYAVVVWKKCICLWNYTC